jgi:hypothetical protein
MACCTAVTYCDEGGELVGDPIDVQLFKASKYNMVEGEVKTFTPPINAASIGRPFTHIATFDFQSSL